jgi:hypothetical protein
MSWLFSQALVEEYLGDTCLDGELSAPLSGNPTQLAYLPPDRMTKFSRLSRFGMTFRPLTADRGEELLTLYLADFRARTSQQPDEELELTESDQECGRKWQELLARYDPATSLWKTPQCSLLGDYTEFSETWPRWGSMQDGVSYQQQTLVLPISETEFGLSLNIPPPPRIWPTPTAHMSKETNAPSEHNRNTPTLTAQVNWATPTVCGNYNRKGASKTSGDGLATQVGGKLNPMWVEWLMGWPLGWTDLKPLEMDKYQQWLQQHGDS